MQPNILIAEDSEDDWVLVKRAFSKAGPCTLHRAKNGHEAIKQLSDEVFLRKLSLLVCDLKMPVLDGFDCLRFVKGEKRLGRLPFVVLTNSNEERDRRKAKELGADLYLVKPSQFGDLVDVARRLIEWASKGSDSSKICRVLVRDSKTGLFFQGANRWTRRIDDALNFENVLRAKRFCEVRLATAQIFAF